MRYLARLPVMKHCTLDGLKFCLVHATPRDPLDEYVPADTSAWQERIKAIDADVVCVGHTHQPFVISVGGRQVLNPGSVGQPRDRDPRAAYAVIQDGKIELRRAEYDIGATLEQMRSTPVPDWVVELTERILTTGGQLTREEMDAIR